MSEERKKDTQESGFIDALRRHEVECKERHQEIRQGFKGIKRDIKDIRQGIKDVTATIRKNLTIMLIAVGVGIAVLGYLPNKPSSQVAQTSQPQIIFLDVQSILEQQKAGTSE